jgi:hypothetical protein
MRPIYGPRTPRRLWSRNCPNHAKGPLSAGAECALKLGYGMPTARAGIRSAPCATRARSAAHRRRRDRSVPCGVQGCRCAERRAADRRQPMRSRDEASVAHEHFASIVIRGACWHWPAGGTAGAVHAPCSRALPASSTSSACSSSALHCASTVGVSPTSVRTLRSTPSQRRSTSSSRPRSSSWH